MFERILIPTDGSEPARNAAKKGVELAAEHGATVHAVYAVEPIPLGGFTAGPEPASAEHGEVVDAQKTEGQEAIDEVVELAAEHDLETVEAIEYGKPDVEILEYAADEEIDAIVMGTHGRSGAGRLVMGSVAEKVVRRSPVPVVTVRMDT
ncbi:universal stress protein [Natronorubrum sp. JWXQ-INN-674]|uniref:Universal stress protein n=1 Tax=Natronorubrum halalkaliphilum TaxID=2691917 RepID=A0A6B0VPM2_9EURY|nr:universal stress protein [Natronorubrum halalkaliphilum]MXV63580.1 universal stress protein [Natronorubrum halalkaliphilum]